jgi:hypothetical protein
MVIANPIYDVVFKRLMENDKVAKFFIGTLLDQTIETIEVKPQEFTFIKDLDQDDPEVEKYINKRIRERLSINVMRLDFVATIKTDTGELKKVLIEIQKARNQVDLMRFRNYLAEQYKKTDIINDEKVALPITTIYILGFKLPEIETPCLKVERNYKDLVVNKQIKAKSDFVEKLTHDSFIVQVNRITDRYQTRLDKLLSIFEQTHFVDDKKIIKQFNHPTDIDEIREATTILHYSGTDPDEKKKIEIEQEAWRTINAMFEDEMKMFEKEKKAFENEKKILEDEKTILEDEKKEIAKALTEKDQALTEKDQALTEKDRLIEELMRKLGEK